MPLSLISRLHRQSDFNMLRLSWPIATFNLLALSTGVHAATISSCAPCSSVDTILGQCSLPLLTSSSSNTKLTYRNVTGVIEPDGIGPSTFILSSIQDASCFC